MDKIKRIQTFGAKPEAFSFTIEFIRKSPVAIPLVEASFFVGTPLDVIRTEHEL